MKSQTPLLFPTDLRDAAKAYPHPYSGLPGEIIGAIGPNGLGGINAYFNHFLNWEGPLVEGAGSGWTLSGVTGVATITQPNTRIGEIAITADATANADPTLQLGGAAAPANFIYSVGKRIWVAARLKIATVGSTELFFGLGTPDTEPSVTNTFPSDGIFFDKAAAATKLDFHARKDGTSTEKLLIGSTLTDGAYTVVGFFIDALGHIYPHQDGNIIGAGIIAAGAANIPGAADVMQFMVGFRGASQVVTLDWLIVAQDV